MPRTIGEKEPRSIRIMLDRALRLLDFVSLLSFALVWLSVARRALTTLPGATSLVCTLLALPFGYIVADFGSGLVHWFCDRFLREDTPVLGPVVIRPYREHHADPQALTRHGLLELSGNSALTALPVLFVCQLALARSAAPAVTCSSAAAMICACRSSTRRRCGWLCRRTASFSRRIYRAIQGRRWIG